MPRKSVYSPSAHEAIVQALRAGATYRSACQAAGLSWATWKEWKRAVWRGEKVPHPGIEELVREAEEAHARSTNALIARVNIAGAKDWRAAMSLIEFRATAERRRWELVRARAEAQIAKARLNGTLPAERHEVSLSSISDAELDARIRELEGSSG